MWIAKRDWINILNIDWNEPKEKKIMYQILEYNHTIQEK